MRFSRCVTGNAPPPLIHSDKSCSLTAGEIVLAYASANPPAQIHTSSKCKLFPPHLSRFFWKGREICLASPLVTPVDVKCRGA